MASDTAEIKREFEKIFGSGGRIHVVRAPGRVNLIGEHTDYNDGFVFPMAIEPEVRIVCRARGDALIRLASTAYPGLVAQFALDTKIERGEPQWANYPRGVAAELINAGIPLVGMDALFSNTLPVGGGLSSSAAIEVGTARALLAMGNIELDNARLALLCQRAEHEFARVPCGIMDQTIVAAGKAGHAMLLDCRTSAAQFIPIDSEELRVVIVNSMVKHQLSTGAYAERRQQCEAGVAFFREAKPAVKALRDVSIDEVQAARDKLPDMVWRRCRHVVTENSRTTEAASLLNHRNYERLGELMVQSHQSLRDDFEVSCVELDFLVAEAVKVKGVYGARMTGGGFGGCIVALAQPRRVDELSKQLATAYTEKFGKAPAVYITTATAGAGVLE